MWRRRRPVAADSDGPKLVRGRGLERRRLRNGVPIVLHALIAVAAIFLFAMLSSR